MSDMYNQRTTSRPVNACFSVRSILMSSCVRWDPLLAHANRRGKATRFWSVESFLPDWAGIVKDRQSDLVPSEVVPRIRRLVFRNRSEPKSTEGTRPPRGTRPVPSGLVPRIRRLALSQGFPLTHQREDRRERHCAPNLRSARCGQFFRLDGNKGGGGDERE